MSNLIDYSVDNNKNHIIYSNNISNILIQKINFYQTDKKVLFVYDKKISKHFINDIKTKLKLSGNIIIFKELEGEKFNKNLNNLLKLIDILIKNKFTKNSLIISCGGGVIGDLCGLLSSLYLRGTIYYQIPTTMTAIVDSCIGGKTGINYKGIINSLGNYHHPNIVMISENLIKKIPDREYFAGFAEIIKCGLIGNQKILNYLENDNCLYNRSGHKNLSKIILETLKTKIKFFKNDVREKNERLLLNFGHTFAHAFEMATEKLIKKDFLRHGEAVGLGMLCEIMLSNNENNKSNKIYKLTEKLLTKFNLPVELEIPVKKTNLLHTEIYNGIFLDKKTKNLYPRFINLNKIFKPKIMEIKNFNQINYVINKIFKN